MGVRSMSGPVVLELDRVRVWTPQGAELLRELSWVVRAGEHWALLGPNGAGKSTLLSVVGAVRQPSSGHVSVLGNTLGRVDLRELRAYVGMVAPSMRLPGGMTVEEVVLTGVTGTIQAARDGYTPVEHARARSLMELLGCAALAGRRVERCSQGERQRVRIARALMASPPLLLLDEPSSALDLPARETLLAALSVLADTQPRLATVLVAHQLEDLPPSTTHALLLRHGQVVAAGPVADVLTSTPLSACFGLEVRVRRDDDRWTARSAGGRLVDVPTAV
jgi:iron complex transport system ATP-binding protein